MVFAVSLRLKIIIGILSVVLATIVVLGDGVLHTALGFPRYLGRATFLIALTIVIALIIGWQWWTDSRRPKRRGHDKSERR